MAAIHDYARPGRHVEPWRTRNAWGLILCAATGAWLAIAFVIGGGL